MGGIHRIYGPALRAGLARPRATLAAALAIFVLSLALVPAIGFSLFPTADIPQFRVRIEAPDGASLAETDRALRFVDGTLAKTPGHPLVVLEPRPREPAHLLQRAVAQCRRERRRGLRRDRGLRAGARPTASSTACATTFEGYPGARISVHQFENGPPVAAPIEIRVIGPDIETLRLLAGEVEKLIAGVPGNPRRDERGAPAAHRPRPSHRHREGRPVRRAGGRGRPHRAARGRGPRPPASSASRTATSTTSRCGCRSRAGRRSTC